MEIKFEAVSDNESFARVVVAAYMTKLNPTLEEIEDVKTAVSEAVTNAIIHGYEEQGGDIIIRCKMDEDSIYIEIQDEGVGILNVEQAMQPLFTTKPDLDRSGMGFVFMEAFMDEVEVESKPRKGTIVKMKKRIGVDNKTWTTQSL